MKHGSQFQINDGNYAYKIIESENQRQNNLW